MALGLTQPLTVMSTRDISWGKGGRCVRLTILPPSCADYLKIWEPQPPETLRAFNGITLSLLKALFYERLESRSLNTYRRYKSLEHKL
jgi:hypothetical protein